VTGTLHIPGTAVDGIDPADALQILPPNPDKQTWLAMRRTGIGGSDVSALVGMSRWEAPIELWEDKTGRVPLVDGYLSEEAEMGVLLEPVVRDRFARVHSLEVRLAGMFRSTAHPWMLANPDGLVVTADGLEGYEGKTCGPWQAHEWGSFDDPLVPDHAELQAHWGMAVTGLPGWWVACLIAGQHNVYRYVARDDAIVNDLVEISKDWWDTHVLGDVEPPPDGSDAYKEWVSKRYRASTADKSVEVDAEEFDDLVRQRQKLMQAEKDAVSDHEALKNRVRRTCGDAESVRSGPNVLATWKTTKKFKQAEFRKHEPEKAAKYTVPATVEFLDVKRLAADEPELYRAYLSRELRFTD
jgi:putative phage-type endonuclease